MTDLESLVHDLWGKAQDHDDYDKQQWKRLQRGVERLVAARPAAAAVDSLDRLAAFRARVYEGVAARLKYDGHCKRYEGTVSVAFPNYFEHLDGEEWVEVRLSCYVLGPSRHYSWLGDTLDEALDKAFADLESWIGEASDGD